MDRKKLTKWTLIWRSAKELTGGFSLIIGFVVMVLIVGGVIRHRPASILVPLLCVYVAVMAALALIVASLGFARGLRLLRRQEKLFGFRFSDEELDADRPDGRWFISTDFYLLAFRRDFIGRVGKIRALSGWGMSELLLWDCEGKKHKIRGKYMELKALKRWFKPKI